VSLNGVRQLPWANGHWKSSAIGGKKLSRFDAKHATYGRKITQGDG
jgi:hypothetical protein